MIHLHRPTILQPPGTPIIDGGHPLAERLLTFATPFSSSLGIFANGGTATTLHPGVAGRSIRAGFTNFNTTNFVSSLSLAPPAGSLVRGVTFYCRVRPLAHGDNATTLATARFHSYVEVAANNGFGIASTAPATNGIAGVLSMGAFRAIEVSGITLGKWYDAFIDVPDNSASSYVRLYVVGLGSATSTTGSMGNTFSGPATIYFGHKLSTSTPGDRHVECAALWDRVLSDDEKERFARNPYQVLVPRQIIVPYQVASGYTHPTLSNARMTSLTSGGGIPNVDYAF